MPPAKRESGLVIAFPELEVTVGDVRRELDPSARWGTPPHVTLLYPFVDPDQLGPDVLDRIAEALLGIVEFEVSFAELGWFGQEVLWLAPVPAAPIVDLIARLGEAFPEHLPYGGEFAEPIPHLTVGVSEDLARLESASALVASRLPLRASVAAVTLMVGASFGDGWEASHQFPLAPAERFHA